MSATRLAIATPSTSVYSETFIAAHLKELKEVVLVLSDGMPPRMANGKPLYESGDARTRLRLKLEQRLRGWDTRTVQHQRLVELLKAERVQVLLAEYGPMGDALVDACSDAGVPLVVHFHGYDAHMHSIAEAAGGYRRMLDAAAAIVVVSRGMEARLLELGAPKDRLHYICYGIDLERFTAADPDKAPPHFLAVGRFVEKKAPHLLILAFAQVAAKHPEARLTLVGDGALFGACQQLVNALGLGAQVDMPGPLKPEEVAALFRRSRAFVQHSVEAPSGDREGTPLAVLESMACGVPVVATRHAGIGDVIEHEVSGLLCAEHDIEGMARNMERMLTEQGLAGRMGVAGRARAERDHTLESSIAGLQAILDKVAK
jgi:glycosyltransferase involved in cell wall biosynthesis